MADSGNGLIRGISSSGTVSTLGAGSTKLIDDPRGVAVDSAGNVYVADTGHNTIQEIGATGGVTTVAGLSGVAGYADGAGGAALFNQPKGIAVDGAGKTSMSRTRETTS